MIKEEPKYDRVVAYVRKSSEDNEKGEGTKQLNSLEYQRDFVKEAIKKYELKLIHEKFEDDKTGYEAFVRDGFEEMLNFLKDHKGEVDGIICTEISRLARNFADGGMILWYLQSGTIKRIYTPSKVFTDSSSDQLMVAIEFAMSKKSSDDGSYRTKEGMKSKAHNIKHPSQSAILGYKGEGLRGRRKWIVDPINGPLLTKVFEQFATGKYTLQEISDYSYEIGIRSSRKEGKAVSKNAWFTRLRDIKYTGVFDHDGERIVGEYVPLVSDDLFYDVQNVLFDKRHEKETSIDYAYSKMIKCEHCGGFLSGTHKKGITYYRCSKRKTPCKNMDKISYIPEPKLEEQIIKMFASIEIDEQTWNKCYEYIVEVSQPEQQQIKQQLRQFREKFDAENTQQNNFGRRFGDEDLSKVDYDRLMEDSKKRQRHMERTIKKLEEIETELKSLMTTFIDSIHNITKELDIMLPENKRELVSVFCENLLWKEGKLEWLWKKPYYLFAKREKCSDVLPL